MNMKKLALCLLMASALPAVSHAETHPAIHSINGGKGILHFTGEINDGACDIDVGSARQDISLPSVRMAKLKTGGAIAGEQDFSISLKDCDATTYHTVKVTFTGDHDTNGAPHDSFSGKAGAAFAKNVGLRIMDNVTHGPIGEGVASTPIALNTGDNTLHFSAAYESGAVAATAGLFDAAVNFKLDYQ